MLVKMRRIILTTKVDKHDNDKNIHLHTVNPAAVATPWWEKSNDAQSDNMQVNKVVINNFRSPWSS